MNKIYLFGQVISKSNLKYEIYPKLKLYMECIIQTCDGNIFNCIVLEQLCDKLQKIKLQDYVFVIGYGMIENEKLCVYVQEIES